MTEYIVTIKDRSRLKKQRRKTLVLPAKRGEIFGRRRPVGIRIWDMGYLLDGSSYINLPYVDPNISNPVPWPYVSPTLADYDQIRSLVFAVPEDEWKTTFKQIDSTYGSQYGSVLGHPILVIYRGTTYLLNDTTVFDGDKLTPNGATPTEQFRVSINTALSRGFTINGPGQVPKVTSELDYSADAVSFTPSRKMDVFLMPALVQVSLFAIYNYSGSGYTEDFLNYLNVIYPRDIFTELDLDIAELEAVGFSWYWLQINPPPIPAYEIAYKKTAFWRDNHGLRAMRDSYTGSGGHSYASIATNNYAPFSSYPAPPSYPINDGSVISLDGIIGNIVEMPGVLLAVIKKGNSTYYVWQDS
jgi:hypothetical protein